MASIADPAILDIFTNTTNNYIHSGGVYCIRSLLGGGFNLAVWRFFVCLPHLNNANIVS